MLRRKGAQSVVLAVPVAPVDTVEELRAHADEVICLRAPAHFGAIGQWYADFRQVSDTEVATLLAERAAVAAANVR